MATSMKVERLLALWEIKNIIDDPTLDDCVKAEEIRILLANRDYVFRSDAREELEIYMIANYGAKP